MRARFSHVVCVFFLLLAFVPRITLAQQSGGGERSYAPEYRALWVDAFHPGIKTPAEVDELIANAKRSNLNALIVQVRRRGDAYFNNSIEPRTTDPQVAPLPYDPLGYLIQQAHAANPPLEVHAWMNVYNVGTMSQVWQQHAPEWANRRPDGSTGAYLDPGHPQVNAYLHEIVLSVVRNYDVDGIHFDFVRYPEGGNWGYSPAAVQSFNEAFGGTGPPANNDPDWKQWRRDRVTEFVRNVYTDALAEKPKLKISGALIAFGSGPIVEEDWLRSAAFNEVYQDWRSWLDEGILDLGVIMNYDREHRSLQQKWFNDWIEWDKNHQGNRGILVGVGGFLNYPEDALAQIGRVRQPSSQGNTVLGVALYSYASTNVYSNADFYTNPTLANGLPRQPYTFNWDPDFLAMRARDFNDFFYQALSQATSYPDPSLGEVSTTPPFPNPAPVPLLTWK
jgi:uncharacterized lipoprotein YddW (UPF0748 family)